MDNKELMSKLREIKGLADHSFENAEDMNRKLDDIGMNLAMIDPFFADDEALNNIELHPVISASTQNKNNMNEICRIIDIIVREFESKN